MSPAVWVTPDFERLCRAVQEAEALRHLSARSRSAVAVRLEREVRRGLGHLDVEVAPGSVRPGPACRLCWAIRRAVVQHLPAPPRRWAGVR